MKQVIRAMMLEDILEQGERVLSQLPTIEAQVARIFTQRSTEHVSRVLIVGCGDSYYAGMATRQAFLAWSGIWADAVESLEFRYVADQIPTDSLVIGVSVSGQVERTLDCLARARERGCLTVGITGTPESRIYEVAEHVIDTGIRVREPGPVPQTVYYLANLVALYAIALRLGEVNGHLTEQSTRERRAELVAALQSVEEVARSNQGRVMNYVKQQGAPQQWVIVGGGPNWATAHFGVAKLIEAALVYGVFQELEEWAHEQFFLTGPNLHTIVIGSHGTVWDRVAPTMEAVSRVGGHLAAIIPHGHGIDTPNASVWGYPAGIPEELSPIVTKVSLELLAYSLAEVLDRRPFNYDSETRKATVEETIYHGGVSAEAVNRRGRGHSHSPR